MTPEDYGMTAAQWEAFTGLLPEEDQRTGDPKIDVPAAMRASMEFREMNGWRGHQMVVFMQDVLGMSAREMEAATGIPFRTLLDWKKRPPRVPGRSPRRDL